MTSLVYIEEWEFELMRTFAEPKDFLPNEFSIGEKPKQKSAFEMFLGN